MPQVISPQFASVFQRKLQALDMNPRTFSGNIGAAYDHIRKIYNGQAFPGRDTLNLICEKLGFDYNAMHKLVVQDKLKAKGYTSLVTSRDQDFLLLESLWKELTDDDKEDIRQMIQNKAKRNRALAAASGRRHR